MATAIAPNFMQQAGFASAYAGALKRHPLAGVAEPPAKGELPHLRQAVQDAAVAMNRAKPVRLRARALATAIATTWNEQARVTGLEMQRLEFDAVEELAGALTTAVLANVLRPSGEAVLHAYLRLAATAAFDDVAQQTSSPVIVLDAWSSPDAPGPPQHGRSSWPRSAGRHLPNHILWYFYECVRVTGWKKWP